MVIYGCCLNNVLINSVKFNKKQILRHFYGKVSVWISSQKGQVICGCENVSLGRTASLSVKILFNHQIFRATQFHSWGGCCFRLTSASCAYFWNKNSFPRSCSSRYCASSVSGHRCRYGTLSDGQCNYIFKETKQLILDIVWGKSNGTYFPDVSKWMETDKPAASVKERMACQNNQSDYHYTKW